MPRTGDLDTIAPDDAVSPASSPSKKPSISPAPSANSSSNKPKTKKAKSPLSSNPTPPPPPVSPVAEIRKTIDDLLGRTSHPLSAFLAKPKVFSFQERDAQEEIILVVRRHWFTNLGWIMATIVMIFAPLTLRLFPLLDFLPTNFQFIAILFWYTVTFAYAFEKFISWYFNVGIITDERVVDIDFNNLLDKKFSDAKISMIQDVTSRVSGVSQTLFNYGSVFIQTAAEVPEIEFEKVPSPDRIIKILQQLRQEEEQEAIEGRVR